MKSQNNQIKFPTGIVFEDAATILWAASGLEISPNALLDVVIGEHLTLVKNDLSIEEKIEAFDFLAETNQLRMNVAAKVDTAKINGPRDLMLCCSLVTAIVDGGLTKTESIKRVVQFYSHAKSKNRDHPDLFRLFKVANNRQIEAIWAKYRPVLHYVEAVAHDALGEPRELRLLQKYAKLSRREREERANFVLRTLREKGLVDEAFLVWREDA